MRAAWAAMLIGELLLTDVAKTKSDTSYATGQIWTYRTRPQDRGSLLKIAEIDPAPKTGNPGSIYHISVIGVHLHGSDIGTAIEDLPVSRETLDKSVTELITSHAPFPDAADGIQRWRKASGGVFTISVAEILTVVERTMQDSAGQPSKRKPRE